MEHIAHVNGYNFMLFSANNTGGIEYKVNFLGKFRINAMVGHENQHDFYTQSSLEKNALLKCKFFLEC